MGVKVYPKHSENIKSLTRRLKKLCEKEGIMKEIYKHSFYEKPSEKRRRQRKQAARRAKQSQLSLQQNKKGQCRDRDDAFSS